MVVNNRHKKNVLNNFRTNEAESEDVSLENLSINEIQTNIIKHSWQYTVQLNPITFYDNNSEIQPNNEHQVWKETHYLSAFDEPSFGSLYASLCRVLDITISCRSGNHLTYRMSFKKCVITVCQNYFQKQCLDNTDIVMSVEHEQTQRRLKMQTIGCVRFIGEIFKQSILSPYVVHYCLKTLQSKTKERSIEYLCNLLKVAGKELNEKISLEDIFEHLIYLVSDEMRSKISPRIRFMVKDVIEVVMPSRVF
ncbi:eukaryotic translation initiation factor 4 gamma 3-like isoform X2 [Metopolophium dirhodum]|uniref:eukaryotic translation initiation factor 4 gamma 3-like isoform X2 n=1 Tax=Metopolophium dirhodum TaxID=44670 RepID=UPI00298F89B0|nr:eukaryotic translation initiation factor 4 gamma 3-like isoform X2 [Metopolophium dirhodum]